MEDLLDMIITDESPSKVSDTIKNMLFVKATERVDALKEPVANSMFNSFDESDDTEV